ncbi:MAG: T9SS type B sorting domain-containing protein [Bacteroidetes bacterium]|nr:T9SS type B sorting domain-containing protein [Bacteroidota bacterium]
MKKFNKTNNIPYFCNVRKGDLTKITNSNLLEKESMMNNRIKGFSLFLLTALMTVSQSLSAQTLSLVSQTNVSCNGGTNGSFELQVSGGSPGFKYSIYGGSPFQYSPIFSNLPAATYIASVTDTLGNTDTLHVIISEPAVSLTVSTPLNKLSNVDCFGNSTGFIEAVVSGGTPNYSYSWNTTPTQNTAVASGLKAGSYTVTVIDNNGCTGQKTTTITEPTALSVSSTSTTNVDCKGNATGSVTVAGAGGTTPYTYNIGGGSYASTNTFGSLSSGTYSIGVKDANGCTNTVSITITEPSVLNLTATITSPVCYNDKTGVIALTATGGTSAYSYRVDTTWLTPTSTYTSTTTYNNKYEGKYTAEVKDANGCLDTVQVTIKHVDLVKPVPVPHKILTVYLGALGTVFVSANMSDSASSDNCAIASRSISKTSFNCTNVGYNTVNFKVVDINGNRDSVNYIVNVLDTTKPNLNTRDFTLYLDNSGLATLAKDSVDLGTADQCNTVTTSLSQTLFNCLNSGYNNTQNKVVFTATDANGNTATDTLIITVLDTIKPTLVLKNVSLYLDVNGKANLTTADFDNGSYDNCNIDSLYMSDSAFDCSQTGVNVITITAVDPSRNRSSSTINVTVYDTIKPTLQVKNHTVYLDTTGNGSMTKLNVVALLYDNCGIDTLDVSKLNWTVSDTGVNNVLVWTQDASGNKTGPYTAIVTVIAKDTDGDGIPDFVEGSKDTDGDGVFDYADMDADNDGLLDFIENENRDIAMDFDGDGIPNFKDLDSDNDGIFDIYEVDGSDSDNDGIAGTSPVTVNSAGVPIIANGGTGYNEIDTDGDGKPDYKDLDTDGDGIADKTEGVADPDGDGIGNWRDIDSDGDGIDDNIEGAVDTDGDGVADFLDTDADNDGISDKIEGTVDTDGDGTRDWRDLDSDNDGINDQTEGNIDTDSDGTVDRLDLDSDNDGIPDSVEGRIDTDGDGRGNWRDLDSDDDGIQDSFEAGSNPATPVDTDGDGKPDYLDLDSDSDGILDSIEDVVDTDGDGISDFRDGDSDGDGISDLIEGTIDTDGDGTGDWRDLDSDNDGISDKKEGYIDSDGDGTGDWRDLDSDNDGITDKIEGTVDSDGDGKPDYLDLDSDGDGISDNIEGVVDTDGDGTGDWRDLDSDNDGISDKIEGTVDTDIDGIGDWRDLDSDNDGISDNSEGTVDTDGDGTGDWRDLDSDGDNILDSTEGTVDTDGDGTSDWRDLDSDNDGIADSTEGTNDFDGDGIGNWRDLDSDGDGIVDKTEGTGDKDGDLAGNWLDLDSDGDGISDKIEGTTDTDGDSVADYLDTDSDNDGISDSIEGTTDTDGDGVGDWRDLDSDNDGINDKTEGTVDSDGDGIGNWRDLDSDGDGIDDKTEGTTDTDNDGQPDYLDLDSDNDGISDKIEGSTDTDGDGVGNWRDLDSDNDELLDGDIQEGLADSDKDGIPNYIDPNYFIPEGISPNGDGINDVLYIRGLKAKVFSQATLLVFNRWGQVVYESNGTYKNDWNGVGTNGDTLPEGIYYIVFKYGSTTVDRNIYIKN